MASGRYSKCPECEHSQYTRFVKPVFRGRDGRPMDGQPDLGIVCQEDSDRLEVMRDKQDKIVYDEQGSMVYKQPFLHIWWEYRNASIIELQDIDKFDDLERLQVIHYFSASKALRR